MQGTKLFKLASQINIGKDTIVEFLQSKGFSIENKPTTALTEEMVDIVMDKFSKELRAVEKQREKLERHKIEHHKHHDVVAVEPHEVPQAITPKHDTNAVKTEDQKLQEVSEAHTPVETDTPISQTREVVEAPVHEVQTIHEEVKHVVVENVPTVPQPELQVQQNEPVDVSSQDARKEKESKETEQVSDISRKEDIITETTDIVKETKVQEIVHEVPVVKLEEIKHDVSPKVVEKPSIVEIKAPIVEQQVQQEVSTNVKQEVPPVATESSKEVVAESADEANDTESDGTKRKKKRFTPVEYEAGSPNQLRGLTVLGKIELGKSGGQQGGNKNRRDRDNRDNRPGEKRPERRDDNRRDDRRDNNRPGTNERSGDRNNDRRNDRGGDRPNDRRPERGPNDRQPHGDRRNDRPRTDNRPNDRNSQDRPQRTQGDSPNRPQSGTDTRAPRATDDKTKVVKTQADIAIELAKSKHKLGKRGVGVESIASKIGVITNKQQDDKKRKVKGKKSLREVITEEEVARAIRETRQGMDESSSISQRSKIRQKRKMEREEKEQRRQEELDMEGTILRLTEFVTTSDLANLMHVTTSEVIMKCMKLGLMVTINQRLDKDTITLIADDYGFTVEFIDDQHVQNIDDEEDPEESLQSRPPIVTIMGHVDHGKTSLLDYIRKANVVAGEAGGITQHIGAYHVTLANGKEIGFLDTPGHEAFTAMRARGAQVTDIVVLVVAADDQVMPQTIEAISHANAANVPIVVALNKIDRAEANPDRIKQQLADHGVLVEDWGGKYQCVPVSAKQGLNIDLLLEKILLEAELLDLRANPDRLSRGTVIEAHLDKGKGILATVLVQKGTLRVGDPFVVGIHSGRVRAMFDERGHRVQEAGPSIPVQLSGFDGLPTAGDIFVAMEDESEAKEIATRRQLLAREQQFKQVRHTTLDDISAQIKQGGTKELKLIIKGDVGGSVEALSDSLHKLSRDEVKVNIILKGVGSISEGDVMLAAASDAVIIGFNTAVSTGARRSAESEGVDVRLYNIIYDCINEIQLALEGLLSPEIKEEVTGTVEVRQIFRISKLGTIAGCYVQNGKITRNDKIRVLRDGFVVFKGGLQSLKRIKDDVREVETGFECGIAIQGFNDFEEGDIIEAYKITEIKRKLT